MTMKMYLLVLTGQQIQAAKPITSLITGFSVLILKIKKVKLGLDKLLCQHDLSWGCSDGVTAGRTEV